jgi:N-acyl-D-aspartate/D-glutamate deacylase
MYDTVIRNGTVVDGTGGEPFQADVALVGGRIAAVGTGLGPARDTIDASGLLVTPGFVDIHTHYDGQVTWESRLSPSSNHGVTTIVTGNCGVGFAPCRPEDHDGLIALMAGVEDIPEVVMADGLEWNWESFPDYLDVVAARPHDVDIAALIPHSALRVYVMGDRAVRREHASAADIAAMAGLARQAMRAGAIGFGTSRAIQQKSIHGDPIPTVGASEAELQGIVSSVAAEGGYFQVLSDFEQFKDVQGEFAMLARVVDNANARMTFTVNQKHSDPDGWRQLLALTEAANDRGVSIKAQVLGRPTGLLMSHELTMTPFDSSRTFRKLKREHRLPDLVSELHRPEVKQAVLAELDERGRRGFGLLFTMDDDVNYEPDPATSLSAKAAAAGRDVAGYVYDFMLEEQGRRLIFAPAQNYADGSLNAPYEMMLQRDTVLGLGDGGAHCGLICDASYPTTMLAYWARDRVRGPRLALPEVVKKLAADTADMVGLHDRGRVAPGYKADLNLIDFEHLRMFKPQPVYDLPTGGRRIIQNSQGYVATIVSGVITYRHGEATGALPGQVVRGAQVAPVPASVA